MKWIIRFYYKLIPTYNRLELKLFSWEEADKLLRENEGKLESQQWHLAKEDNNHAVELFMPTVWLERKERVYE